MSFYESLLFLADFVTLRNTQSNLERCQQSNSEKNPSNQSCVKQKQTQ